MKRLFCRPDNKEQNVKREPDVDGAEGKQQSSRIDEQQTVRERGAGLAEVGCEKKKAPGSHEGFAQKNTGYTEEYDFERQNWVQRSDSSVPKKSCLRLKSAEQRPNPEAGFTPVRRPNFDV